MIPSVLMMRNPETSRFAWPDTINHMMVNLLLDSNRVLDESLVLHALSDLHPQ